MKSFLKEDIVCCLIVECKPAIFSLNTGIFICESPSS